MSSKSGDSLEADTTVLRYMYRQMKTARERLENQDLDGAVDAIDGMTEDTDCSACVQIETHILGGLAFIRVAPSGRKGSTARKVIQELENYIERFEKIA